MASTVIAQTSQFVSFKVNDKWYCCDIHMIREVNQNVSISEVPLAEPHICGLVNIRGQVVLVLDINVLTGLSEVSDRTASQIIILKTIHDMPSSVPEQTARLFGDKSLSFLVDCIGDVIITEHAEIEPPPEHLPDSTRHFYSGMLQRNDTLFVILNVPALLETCAYTDTDE